MNSENPLQPSPDERAEIEKQRVLSDAELLKSGAEYKADEAGEPRLEVTLEQANVAKREMEVALQGGKEEKKLKSIEHRGNLLIEVSNDGERLLDSTTGEPLTWFNKKIREEDGITIATRDYGVENTLNPKTGEAMQGPAYEKIFVRDGLRIGILEGAVGPSKEFLLDRSTGRSLSRPFEKIEKRDGHIIGTDHDGEVKIVPRLLEPEEVGDEE